MCHYFLSKHDSNNFRNSSITTDPIIVDVNVLSCLRFVITRSRRRIIECLFLRHMLLQITGLNACKLIFWLR